MSESVQQHKGYIPVHLNYLGNQQSNTISIALIACSEQDTQDIAKQIQEITEKSIVFIETTQGSQEQKTLKINQKIVIQKISTETCISLTRVAVIIQLIVTAKENKLCILQNYNNLLEKYMLTSTAYLQFEIWQMDDTQSINLGKEIIPGLEEPNLPENSSHHIKIISTTIIALLVLVVSLYFPTIRTCSARIYEAIKYR